MVSPQSTTNWLYDYSLEDISLPNSSFIQPLHNSANLGVDIDGSFGKPDGMKESGSKKRPRTESCASSSSKACREKMRRDRLNDKCVHVLYPLNIGYFLSLSDFDLSANSSMLSRFMELGALLEPGRPPKTDKASVLVDAVRKLTQLRSEIQKLMETNSSLQEKIKELKVRLHRHSLFQIHGMGYLQASLLVLGAGFSLSFLTEKTELREDKQRMKAEKEKLEQQLKTMNAQPSFTLPAMSAAFAPQAQAAGNKLVPVISYPGVAMWQFMPPAAVDTSQDHVLRPPVA
ncbi:hypothetical protein Leryth_005936 [Lithospermum erythrorhizon]|nr:hypothetical protein Leryth_005936 [Lithospermum erythrorhizon]